MHKLHTIAYRNNKKKIHEKINIKALKNQSPAINVVIKTNYSFFSGYIALQALEVN
jgi:hypothetical protein